MKKKKEGWGGEEGVVAAQPAAFGSDESSDLWLKLAVRHLVASHKSFFKSFFQVVTAS